VWPKLAPWITSALEHGTSSTKPDDVRQGALKGEYQLWVAWEDDFSVRAVCVTEVIGPRCRIFICMGIGREDWFHHLETIEEWAREKGCTSVLPCVRPGWVKDLSKAGYRKRHITMEKML